MAKTTSKNLTEEIRGALVKGTALTAPEVAEKFGCSPSLLGSVIRKMMTEGYDFEVTQEGNIRRFMLVYGPDDEIEGEEPVASVKLQKKKAAQSSPDTGLLGQTLLVRGIILGKRNEPHYLLRDQNGQTWSVTITGQVDGSE